MNKNAQKWIKELRSGRYNQMSGFLTDGKSFCCLGLACHLYQMEHSETSFQLNRKNNMYSFLNNERHLPVEVMDWLGLKTVFGDFGKKNALIEFNDNGVSFSDIADIIAFQPTGLFK